jgi:hypothetical protein
LEEITFINKKPHSVPLLRGDSQYRTEIIILLCENEYNQEFISEIKNTAEDPFRGMDLLRRKELSIM